MGQLEQWGLEERENPDSSSHIQAIAWENEKSNRIKTQMQSSRRTFFEEARGVEEPHENKPSYEYGSLFIEFEQGNVYQYFGVPYRYYYYLWKSPHTQGRWGEYVYYNLSRMHLSPNPRDPQANQSVSRFPYRRIK